MASIDFSVPAIPVAQPRQRHRIVHKYGKPFASNYTPVKDPVNSYKAVVRLAAEERALPALQRLTGSKGPIQGPVTLYILFYLPRPKSLYWKKREMNRLPHTSKPDVDNLAKSTIDALTGILWMDDRQIYSLHISKMICDGTEPPRVEVSLCIGD